MNHPTLYGVQVQPNTCGRTAVENTARAFWQLRQTTAHGGVARLIVLADIPALAKAVRDTYPGA